MKSYIKENYGSFVMIIVMVIASYFFYPLLPDQLPIHFDAAGVANSYASKLFALASYPAISLLLVILLSVLLRLSPKGYQLEQDPSALTKMNFAVTFLFFTIFFATILSNLFPHQISFPRIFAGGLGVFMILVGNYLSQVKQNFFIGIRTPWTITSENNWLHTHRFAGRLFFIAGILSIISALADAPFQYIFWGNMIAALSPILYSLLIHLRPRRQV